MRFAHLSDLHLGYRTGDKYTADEINIREEDGYTAFRTLIQDILDSKIDFVVVSGDSFHTPKPSIRTILELQDGLRRLADANIPVRMIAGNHDVNDYKGDVAASQVVHDADRNILSHAEPYIVSEVTDGVFVHMISHHMYRTQADTMNQVKPIDGAINILSTHGSVIDPLLEEKIKVEESPREIVIPDFFLRDMSWDVMALGHIHERRWVGDKKDGVFYNGSLIRRGFSDGEGTLGRGYTVWDNHTGEWVPEFHNVPQRPQYDLPPLDASTLSAPELTETIINRLRDTQTTGREFVAETAPMIRQKIVNITPAKASALDYPAISAETTHALTWQLERTLLGAATTPTEIQQTQGNDFTTNMVDSFNTWVETADEIQRIDDTGLRDTVVSQTKKFIQYGRDKALEIQE